VVHDLHALAGVHAAQVGQEPEAESGLVVEGGQDLGDRARPDPDLGLVMTLPDRAREVLGEARLQAGLEGDVHVI
jgi:hypothetical protein